MNISIYIKFRSKRTWLVMALLIGLLLQSAAYAGEQVPQPPGQQSLQFIVIGDWAR